METLESATVLIHCQNPILTLGIQTLFEKRNDLIAIVTSNFERALDIAKSIRPDVLMLESISDVDLSFLRALKGQSPESKAALWIESISSGLACQAFNLGVTGILYKTLSPQDLFQEVRAVAQGIIRISAGLMDAIIVAKTVKLTKRESELVTLVAQGLKNKEISAEMNMPESTVKAYLSRLFQKLNVTGRLDLAHYGVESLRTLSRSIDQRASNAFLTSGFTRRNAAPKIFNPATLPTIKD